MSEKVQLKGGISEPSSDIVEGEARWEMHKKQISTLSSPNQSTNDSILQREPDSASDKPSVIFIHGMNSDIHTWDKMLDWLKDKDKWSTVNYPTSNRTLFENYEIWRFGYNSRHHVGINGGSLLEKIEQEKIEEPIIVAHSMGGIVARACISKGGTITKLVTIGTPHWGSGQANWSLFGFMGDGCEDIKWGSDYLRKLEMSSYDRKYRREGKYTLFSGEIVKEHWWSPFYKHDYPKELEVAGALLGGNNDGCVPMKSALFCWDDDNKSCYAYGEKYRTDWDHFHLTDPEKSQEFFAYILGDFQFIGDWGDYWKKRAYVQIGSYVKF